MGWQADRDGEWGNSAHYDYGYSTVETTSSGLDNFHGVPIQVINGHGVIPVDATNAIENSVRRQNQLLQKRFNQRQALAKLNHHKAKFSNPLYVASHLIDFRDYAEAGREAMQGNTETAATILAFSLLPEALEQLGKTVRRSNPLDIRFTQSTASQNFSTGGHTITSTAEQLRKGKTPEELGIPTIRVVEKDGKLWTLDNRRLATFQAAGLKDIPMQKVSLKDPAIAKEFQKKFNPIDGQGNLIVITPNRNVAKEARKILRKHGKIR